MNSNTSKRKYLILGLVVALPVIAVVEERHYFEVPFTDETSLEANLNLALGHVVLGKTEEEDLLFQAEVTMEDDQKMQPDFGYSALGGEGRLSVDVESTEGGSRSVSIKGISRAKTSDWILMFSDKVPIEMDIEMGAAKADLDFTGLPISELSLESGAAKSTIMFDAPNPVVMKRLVVEAGMSEMRLEGLANARAERINFDAGVGKYTLDFSGGRLSRTGRADIEVGMASLIIILPADEPIILRAPDNWMSSIRIPKGFKKQSDDIWHSPEVEDGDDAYKISVESGIGKVRFAYEHE